MAVVRGAAGLHGKVHRAGASILGRRHAGDHLELIDGFHADRLADEPVVALLTDGLGGHAIQVELAQVISGAANDRETTASLGAWRECSESRRIALGVVHLQGEIGVGFILHHQAQGRRGRVERWWSSRHHDGLRLLADR